MGNEKGILITRTDRIGDLILTLPVLRTVSKVFPDEPLHLMVSSYAYPVVENYPSLASIIRYDVGDEATHVDRTKQMIQHLRELKLKTALMLVYDPTVLSMIKKAGIKERFGPLTKVSGMFFYTKWLSQHRSKVEHHELEYNLSLLKLLGVKEKDFDVTLDLPVSKSATTSAMEKLKKIGFENPLSGYIVIHPSMGGSALNWKYAYYAELAGRLSEDTGLPIVLTGDEEESRVLHSIKQHITTVVFDTSGLFSLKELIAVISKARLFIGPSTGPMHIAAAVSVPVAAIFSPLRVHSPKRWGPYSRDAVTIVPKVDCPAKLKCLGSRCQHYNCMDCVSVDEVFEKARKVYNESIHQIGLSF